MAQPGSGGAEPVLIQHAYWELAKSEACSGLLRFTKDRSSYPLSRGTASFDVRRFKSDEACGYTR